MFHTVFHKSLTLRDQLKCLLFSSSRSDKVPMVLTCLEQVTPATPCSPANRWGNGRQYSYEKSYFSSEKVMSKEVVVFSVFIFPLLAAR